MFYLKTHHEGKPIEVEIYGDEIFTRCYNCGKEIQVDDQLLREVLADGGDLSSTSLACCSGDKPKLIRIK
jgi:hypothetical protein